MSSSDSAHIIVQRRRSHSKPVSMPTSRTSANNLDPDRKQVILQRVHTANGQLDIETEVLPPVAGIVVSEEVDYCCTHDCCQQTDYCCHQSTSYPTTMLCLVNIFLFADQNLMAPNLTQIAEEFGFDDIQRDRKLGGDIALAFFLVGGVASLIVGYLTDSVNRKYLFTGVVVLGETACLCTYWVVEYWQLILLRAATGISIGGAMPLLFSMLGDMYTSRSRGVMSAIAGIAMGTGVGLGQMIAGVVGPTLGWRLPFVIVAIPALVLVVIFATTTKEPVRGSAEQALIDLQQQDDEARSYGLEPIDSDQLELVMKDDVVIAVPTAGQEGVASGGGRGGGTASEGEGGTASEGEGGTTSGTGTPTTSGGPTTNDGPTPTTPSEGATTTSDQQPSSSKNQPPSSSKNQPPRTTDRSGTMPQSHSVHFLSQGVHRSDTQISITDDEAVNIDELCYDQRARNGSLARHASDQLDNPPKPVAPITYEERMNCAKLAALWRCPTVVLIFLQGIPGSLPWGAMIAYFNDFLAQEKGISVEQSTGVVITFGVGSAIGQIIGGLLGDRLYKVNPRLVPVLMGVTTILGAIPILVMIQLPPQSLFVYCIVVIPAGLLVSIAGSIVRALLLNVTLPESRGTAFAFFNLMDDLGKGLGPFIVSLIIQGTRSRVMGLSISIAAWALCAGLMFLMACFIQQDVARTENILITQFLSKQPTMLDFGGFLDDDDDGDSDGGDKHEDTEDLDMVLKSSKSILSVLNKPSEGDVVVLEDPIEVEMVQT